VKCVICKQGETEPGHTTVTLERDRAVLIFEMVPAEVCANCGEAYVSEEVTARLLEEAEGVVLARVHVDVRELTSMTL
jgi:YgiT-type zinc finger domain-containing protein